VAAEVNAERRAAAIEAGARALWAASLGVPSDDPEVVLAWNGGEMSEAARRSLLAGADAVIDAALPHLTPEPVEWIVLNHYGAPAYSGIRDQEEALDRARRWNEGRPADSRYRAVALVPVEDES